MNTKKSSESIEALIKRMVQRIVRKFDPERIILFGSHARGNPSADSDVDLMVVVDVPGSKRERQLEIRMALHDIRVPKDIVVTAPEEFAWRKNITGTLEEPAVREGRILYVRQ